MWVLFFGLLIAYLIGSIPTAYMFGKMYRGMDIREYGSGNVGATNVFRVLGKGPGIIVLLMDIYKGFWIVGVVAEVLGITDIWPLIAMALVVVLGHNYTCFLRFKGGKGVATSLGALIGLSVAIDGMQVVLGITLATFLITFLISKIVSLSSLIAAIILPVSMLATRQPIALIILGCLFSGFVIYRHKPNIERLLTGQEPKVPLGKSK